MGQLLGQCCPPLFVNSVNPEKIHLIRPACVKSKETDSKNSVKIKNNMFFFADENKDSIKGAEEFTSWPVLVTIVSPEYTWLSG